MKQRSQCKVRALAANAGGWLRQIAALCLLYLPFLLHAETTPSHSLAQIFADERAAAWRFDPISATSEGEHRFNAQMPSVAPADQRRWQQENAALLKRLRALDPGQLSTQEQLSHTLFDFILSQRLSMLGYREWRMPLNSDSGFHVDILYVHTAMQFKTPADYENYLKRLRGFPKYFDQQMSNMRQGLRDGFTLPKEILAGVSTVIGGLQFKRAEECPLFRPFVKFPQHFTAAAQAHLRAEGEKAISESVLPSYAKFQRFFEQTYRRGARTTLGASALPDGKAYYADLARYFTTLPDVTPESIHAIGLTEVARIRAEMDAIIAQLEFKGSFADFIQFLRSDPQFYAKTPTELIKEASFIAKNIDRKLPQYFRTMPRTPYGVVPVPEALAPNYTAGRYNPGPVGAAGEYWVNTYALNTRPLYSLPALTLHEAVPGHHLQGALARELKDVPQFRLNFYPHAFGEGWALYSEKLGKEMGVYQTPYEDFGRLSYEMWRACRLVVDTGLHAMGWTREQARDYLSRNTALSEHEVRTEIDRYISWPGQALAYKIGELKFLALRAHAEKALGDRFDIRDFHDALLRNGGLTLPVLEQQVERYINANRRGT